MASKANRQAWEDWGSVNPLFGILTDPRYRHGGDVAEFLETGEAPVGAILASTQGLGLCSDRRSALDFGCGVGRLTRVLARHFERVVGLDVSASMLAVARELNGDLANCSFVENVTDDLAGYPDATFDFVLCLLVLQHLDSTEAVAGFLEEFVRVLRPGGVIVVQLPSKVSAHRPPLAPWRSRRGLQSRFAIGLRRIGVAPGFLYRRLDWVPEMTMLALTDEQVRPILEGAGGKIVHLGPPDVDAGGTESRTYFITR